MKRIVICMYFFVQQMGGLSLPMDASLRITASEIDALPAPIHNEFVIIIPSCNNAQWYEGNLESIRNQTYQNYRVLYYNDVSSDETGELVASYISKHNLQDQFTLINNEKNIGGLGNIYDANHRSPDHCIMVEVDGDDWLADTRVLERLNKLYNNPDVWLTYGNYTEYTSGKRSWLQPIPHSFATKGLFRGHGASNQLVHSWIGHLRTWRNWLFKLIKKEDLCNSTGEFFKLSWDHAMMWPMCEMACDRMRFIDEPWYVYNTANPNNDFRTQKEEQYKIIDYLHSKSRYARLEKAPQKVALISGITGQDGSYLAEFLLARGYIVHGIKRRSSVFNTQNIDHIYKDRHTSGECRFFLHYGDVTDNANIFSLVHQIKPDEIYNLAAQSHVQVSFETPLYTTHVDAEGALNFLEAIHQLGLANKTKFYQASTSELYGKVQSWPQNELTQFYPRSPYAVSKLYAYWITKNYREAYGIFACNGILFNHESPRRGETFVTRKITRAVARIYHGLESTLYLGNLDAVRDWGYAKDYVEGMWRMLQEKHPDDFVLSSGSCHSVREFVEEAFAATGTTISWQGCGVDEVGINTSTGQIVVRIDPRYFRPAEVERLFGDCGKAKKTFCWQPRTSFKELVQIMMQEDLRRAAATRTIPTNS